MGAWERFRRRVTRAPAPRNEDLAPEPERIEGVYPNGMEPDFVQPTPEPIPEPIPSAPVPENPAPEPPPVPPTPPAAETTPPEGLPPADAPAPERAQEDETVVRNKNVDATPGPEDDEDDEKTPGDPDDSGPAPVAPPPGRWAGVREREKALDARLAELDEKSKELDALLAEARKPRAPAAAPPAAGRSPRSVASSEDRYKNVDPQDMVTLTDVQMADVEARLQRGELPSEALREMDLPANRFTLDQVRKVQLRLQNQSGTVLGRPGAPPGPPAAPVDLLGQMRAMRDAGLMYGPKDVQEAIDKALARQGGGGGDSESPSYLNDPESAAIVETAHTLREVGVEAIDAFRELSGHPRLTSAVHEMRAKASRRLAPRTPTPEAPAPPARPAIEGPPAPPRAAEPTPVSTAAPTPAGAAAAQEADDYLAAHPEVYGGLDRLVQVAPIIHNFVMRRGTAPANAHLGNVQKDAASKARGAWILASDSKPLHEWGPQARCVRCGAGKTEENLPVECPKANSEKDMLRRLGGMTVESLIQLIGKYSDSVEFNERLDSLGGLSLRQFFMAKKWGPNDKMDLGNSTIYDLCFGTDEGLNWIGRFLADTTSQMESEGRAAA